jgi:hypothetical protein
MKRGLKRTISAAGEQLAEGGKFCPTTGCLWLAHLVQVLAHIRVCRQVRISILVGHFVVFWQHLELAALKEYKVCIVEIPALQRSDALVRDRCEQAGISGTRYVHGRRLFQCGNRHMTGIALESGDY